MYDCVHVLPGSTAEASKKNLYCWLDAVAVQLNLQHSFVFDENNQRVAGCYQHLSSIEEKDFRKTLNTLTKTWGHQAVYSPGSCHSVRFLQAAMHS